MSQLIEKITAGQLRSDIPDFRPGDSVKVHALIVEGERERVQIFEGLVIKRRGAGISETYTVRKISNGVGVERTFPVHSPRVAKIEVTRKGKVRRAKLTTFVLYLVKLLVLKSAVSIIRIIGPLIGPIFYGLIRNPPKYMFVKCLGGFLL